MNDLAPIVLFTYNRLGETKRTVESLQKNYLAHSSVLYIFSDGYKSKDGKNKVDEVRSYIRSVDGFKQVIVTESPKNKGLANSIIDGVSEVFTKHDKVIVLEDDLVTSQNFLDFMNQALGFYSSLENVISISGYTLDLPRLKNYPKDYYVGLRASSLGWGTWKNKWIDIDWDVSDYKHFKKDIKRRLKFASIGSDLPGMLRNQQENKIDSWAIRWCYHQFKSNMVTVFTSNSKLNHIGIDEHATNAAGVTKFDTPLDDGSKRSFEFHEELEIDKKILKQFKSKFSIRRRISDKIKRMLKNFKS